MEVLTRIDEALIDVVEKALLASRTRLDLSFPRTVSLCGSMTIVMMALTGTGEIGAQGFASTVCLEKFPLHRF
ncbi:hypothetical protein [Ensifer adhaerens]|uniref:hypothetical protein n=1 Tax=Ensifer adhaerens TaxID=106592 RepID=UPI000DC32484|nr:hypothetical protein [Ensifer adhaerens]RAS09775.1 hypothetical protein DEU52_1135 [Ensifer adhaerens]